MENEAVLKYLIHNGKVYSTEQVNPLEDIGDSIYEVVRIIDGVPLYLEEHLARLRKSANLIGVQIEKSHREIIEDIYKLINENKEYNLNVKILCGNFEKHIQDIYLYFINSFYPPISMYDKGIHTILYRTERKNPNAKVSNRELREFINREKREKNAFEALLLNNREQITEGSRSNVFFVKENKLYTPPSGKVLLGVTRTKIIELCNLNGIDVIEDNIYAADLAIYDGAFITGTSVDVLPIRSIDRVSFNSSENQIVKKVMDIYNQDKITYINQKRRKEK